MDGGHAERGERESDAKAGQDHEDRQQVARRIRAYRAQAENACNKAQDGQNHDVSKRSPGRQHAAALVADYAAEHHRHQNEARIGC